MDGTGSPQAFTIDAAEDHLAWIFGSSRSGSTWLLRMLGGLPGVAPIDDPHLGHHLGVWRPISLGWATAQHPPDLTTLDRLKHDRSSYFFSDRYRHVWEPALRRLIVDRFDAEARDLCPDGEPVVVVKEPGSHVADHLVRMFPGSRLVFLLRDGRDVVDSWLAAYRSGSWALDEGAFPVTDEGRGALVRWQSAVWAFRTDLVSRVYEAHPADRRVLVRYEDLVDDPVRELDRVAEVMSIGASWGDLVRVAGEHAYERVPASQKGHAKEIRSATPGGWRQNLTAGEHAVMHEVMGAQLARHGYDVSQPAAAR